MRALRLQRIELTTADLGRGTRFYVEALGFVRVDEGEVPPALAALLGAEAIHQVVLRRGAQEIALQRFDPAGAPYPDDGGAADQVFQHFALPVTDMDAAMRRLLPFGPAPISRGGPQHLPARSGGATAFKFRDPDGHPLELIRFADGHAGGIDHSAIAVADAARSIAFYRDQLGFTVGTSQRNAGPEQERLDGLHGAEVDVVALEPAEATPHVELLAYRTPAVRQRAAMHPRDVAATRLVLAVEGQESAALTTDPDGHHLLLLPGTGR